MAYDLPYYYALWKLGKLPPERIPDIACDALQEGMNSHLLRYLAGLDRPTSREIGSAFDDACRQLGIEPLSSDLADAQMQNWITTATPLAVHIAKDIAAGTIDPVEGWLALPYRYDQPLGSLSVLFEFADREGTVTFDQEFRAKVIDAVKKFLSTETLQA